MSSWRVRPGLKSAAQNFYTKRSKRAQCFVWNAVYAFFCCAVVVFVRRQVLCCDWILASRKIDMFIDTRRNALAGVGGVSTVAYTFDWFSLITFASVFFIGLVLDTNMLYIL